MQKQEVFGTLAARAAELGIRFSERMFRDWVDEGLVQPAMRVPETLDEWSYDSDVIPRGELILALKKVGARRATLLRLYLWISGREIEHAGLLSDLKSEFSRILARARRKNPPTSDTRFGAEPDAWQLRRLSSENQKLDPDFRAVGISYSSDFLTEIFSAFFWGEKEPGAHPDFPNSFFAGAFGAIDEIDDSFIQSLDRVSADDLSLARDIFEEVIFSVILAPVGFRGFIPNVIRDKVVQIGEKIARSLLSPEWLALALVFIAVNVSRFRSALNDNNCSVTNRR